MTEHILTYERDSVYLLIMEEDNILWLTRQQLMILFSYTEKNLQVMLQRIRRLYPRIDPISMRKIPLILQERSAYSKELRETVRCIQHFNFKMVQLLLIHTQSSIAQDFLEWNFEQMQLLKQKEE